MSEAIFNFHDLVLIMTALQCLLFAALLLAMNTKRTASIYFLAAFLVAHAFIPLHELTLWASVFKLKVRELYPNWLFIGGFAYYVDGVLLYFCVKSLIFSDFSLRKRDALHLVPLLLFLIYMTTTFYRHPLDVRLDLIENEETFVYSWHYVSVDLFAKALRVLYVLFCLNLLVRYKELLKATHSNVNRVDLTWLKILVIGFLIVMTLELTLSASKFVSLFEHYEFQVFEAIGLSGYYSLFLLVNVLVFSSVFYFSDFASVARKDAHKKLVNDRLINPDIATQVDEAMKKGKPYLIPDITLDMLAEELRMPVRDLSMVINRHFNVHFYEFVNRYRVEEAKRLLIDPASQNKTITNIYLEAGFNSKSVFNAFFRKLAGCTPSQFREANKSIACPDM